MKPEDLTMDDVGKKANLYGEDATFRNGQIQKSGDQFFFMSKGGFRVELEDTDIIEFLAEPVVVYIPMYANGEFAVGGGSSTPSSIRAFASEASAKRSAAGLPTAQHVWNHEHKNYDVTQLGMAVVRKFVLVEE